MINVCVCLSVCPLTYLNNRSPNVVYTLSVAKAHTCECDMVHTSSFVDDMTSCFFITLEGIGQTKDDTYVLSTSSCGGTSGMSGIPLKYYILYNILHSTAV